MLALVSRHDRALLAFDWSFQVTWCAGRRIAAAMRQFQLPAAAQKSELTEYEPKKFSTKAPLKSYSSSQKKVRQSFELNWYDI